MGVPASAQRQSTLRARTECVDHRPWPLAASAARGAGVFDLTLDLLRESSTEVACDEEVGSLERRPLLVEAEGALTGGRAAMDEFSPREVVEVSGTARGEEAGRDARWRTVLSLRAPLVQVLHLVGSLRRSLELEDPGVDVAEESASRAPQPLREDTDRHADPVDGVSDVGAERLFLREGWFQQPFDLGAERAADGSEQSVLADDPCVFGRPEVEPFHHHGEPREIDHRSDAVRPHQLAGPHRADTHAVGAAHGQSLSLDGGANFHAGS